MEVFKTQGYTVKDAFDALSIFRSGYYQMFKVKTVEWIASKAKDRKFLEKIKVIKLEHLFPKSGEFEPGLYTGKTSMSTRRWFKG
ncbi:MAG: hypothetical protein DDT22_01219 [candidate division WS2 bacterium]|nr:hypothetical protein [Candidatus Lithacetigena glycinireducens]MBT9175539.1 hypothetical protein [Candidatus Lithacetigena glycinireducens]